MCDDCCMRRSVCIFVGDPTAENGRIAIDFAGKFLLRVPCLILSLRIYQRGVSMYVFMFSVYGADICAATFTHLAQAEGGCAGGMHLPISGIALLLI